MSKKPNKLTEGANILHESSRMILPEHKERLIQRRKEMGRKQRPELDDQRLQDIAYAIGQSRQEGTPVTLQVFGDFEDRYVTGTVQAVDQQLRRIKVAGVDGEAEWINLNDIMEVQA